MDTSVLKKLRYEKRPACELAFLRSITMCSTPLTPLVLFPRQSSTSLHSLANGTAAASAARIEIEDAVFLFHFWMMAVSIDHYAESGSLWLQV